MNKKALMLMANGRKGEKGRRVGVEYEDWGARDHYPMTMPYGGYGPYSDHYPVEDKFRDRRGREHYDDGRYAPTSRMGDYPRDYPRYPDSEPHGDYGEPQMNSRYHPYPTYPTYPIYEDNRRERKMNPIGFARDTSGLDATMPRYDNEMERMEGGGMERGYSRTNHAPRFDRQMAEEWMRGLQNEDGTTGPHWDMGKAETVMAQKEIGGAPLAFWAALNMMYSDYCKVAKKLRVNTVDFYACMAEAFLNDKDAIGGGGGEKLAAYYDAVARH